MHEHTQTCKYYVTHPDKALLIVKQPKGTLYSAVKTFSCDLIVVNFYYFQLHYSLFLQRQSLCEDAVGTTAKLSKRSLTYEMARLWFSKFSKFADSMPDSDIKCLPSCLTNDQLTDQPKLSWTRFI